jgi:DNA polymerase III epsilon subunit-like protein
MRKLKEVFIDVETTGLDPESDKVTEFAAIYRLNGKIKARTFIDKDIPRNVKLFLSEIIDPSGS